MGGAKILTFIVAILIAATPIAVAVATTTVPDNSNTEPPDLTSIIGDNKNFASQSAVIFKNINGVDVTVDVLSRKSGECLNNPSFSEAVLLQQCIDYKIAHPEKTVTMGISSFHFSIVAAACVDRTSDHFGEMRSLYDCVEDNDGFIRVSELLIRAAKIGIYVTVIGQIDAAETYHSGTIMYDIPFASYFESRLDESCYGNLSQYVVKDFMAFRECKWKSYGDRSAADMMHTKVAIVSDYIDYTGTEHKYGLFLTSTNLDGIDGKGSNGNDGYQTGAIISDHYGVWNVTYNYLSIMKEYCEQEDAVLFRELIIKMNTEQFNAFSIDKMKSIEESQKIVYLGSNKDTVFKMMFAPFGGTNGSWNEKYNLYCYYVTKLSKSEEYIEFIWNNAKYDSKTEVSRTLMELVRDSFINSNNEQDNLYLHLPNLDTSIFDELSECCGTYTINKNMDVYIHNKDVQMSYVEDGERHYVSVLNSMNIHYGSMFYQSNHLLIIDETNIRTPLFYQDFREETLP